MVSRSMMVSRGIMSNELEKVVSTCVSYVCV